MKSTRFPLRRLLVAAGMLLALALVVSPLFSWWNAADSPAAGVVSPDKPNRTPGAPNGNGNGNGNGGGNFRPTQVVSTPVPSDDLLGCQRNNPSRLDCSSLQVTGVCDGTTAVFTITNTGDAGNGDMRAPTQYRILQDGVVVETGDVLLAGGATMEIRYDGSGTIQLQADQQIGHPGGSQPRVSLNCGGSDPTLTPTATPTADPTATVDPTPTPDPTIDPTPLPPALRIDSFCVEAGAAFVVTNDGGAMTEPAPYTVTDAFGNLVAEGTVQLDAGQGYYLEFSASGVLTLTVLGITATLECQQPTPTVDPTPQPTLTLEAYCYPDTTVFVIRSGDVAMSAPAVYVVTDAFGSVVAQDSIQLSAGESYVVSLAANLGALTLTILDQSITNDCGATPDPTDPPPPSLDVQAFCREGVSSFLITNGSVAMTTDVYYSVVDETGAVVGEGWLLLGAYESFFRDFPGVSGTLTLTVGDISVSINCDPTPTADPTADPTATSTPTGPLGCQQNNPDRLDCSSLQVTATCDGTTALFTITNTGDPGDGDMRAPTPYLLFVDGVQVDAGEVLLLGGDLMIVTYDGGGTVTLVASQQIGHPGNSRPRATIDCGG